MGWQDRDLHKLTFYAHKHGLKVYIRPYTRFTGQAEYCSGVSITLFNTKYTSKTSMILSLLHEFGHHLDWLNTKRNDRVLNEALIILNKGRMSGKRSDLNKKHRAKILQIEKAGIKYMSRIYKTLKLEIPYYKVKHQEELDLFDYKCLYHKGRFSKSREYDIIYKKAGYYKRKYEKRKNGRI